MTFIGQVHYTLALSAEKAENRRDRPMKYNFDEIIPRLNTNSIKYDFPVEMGKPADVLPLWVADMDFQVPKEVTEKLETIVRHAIYGYSDVKNDYFAAVKSWFSSGFGFEPEAEWMIKAPGVVFALAQAVQAFTEPGDAVIIQRPVYKPFSMVVEQNNRKLVDNPLIYKDGRYTMDLADFEQKVIDNKAKMFIFCSPHNPVGRVWTEEELREVAGICLKHKCLMVSDEIHCDFTRPGHTHHILPALSPEIADNCVLCTAPSKTFNLAGLQASNIFIANDDLRARFQKQFERIGFHCINDLGAMACKAAYEHGRDWLDQLKVYLEGNLSFLKESLAEVKGVKVVEPEGTYLVWLDFTSSGLSPEALKDKIINKARVWFDEGEKFSPDCGLFQRVNTACPRATLTEALKRVKSVL